MPMASLLPMKYPAVLFDPLLNVLELRRHRLILNPFYSANHTTAAINTPRNKLRLSVTA
jgi:hypothetical protein